jgi:hypothetical protein
VLRGRQKHKFVALDRLQALLLPYPVALERAREKCPQFCSLIESGATCEVVYGHGGYELVSLECGSKELAACVVDEFRSNPMQRQALMSVAH